VCSRLSAGVSAVACAYWFLFQPPELSAACVFLLLLFNLGESLSSASSALLFYLLRAQSRYLAFIEARRTAAAAAPANNKIHPAQQCGAFDSRKIFFCGRTDAAAGADSRSLLPPHGQIIVILVWKLIAWSLINVTLLSIRKLGLFGIALIKFPNFLAIIHYTYYFKFLVEVLIFLQCGKN
jgi:hypothetical protein